MIKKKSPIASNKSPSRKLKVSIKHRYNDDNDHEFSSDSIYDEGDVIVDDYDIDEFEHLQALSDKPGTLHEQEEDLQEEDDMESDCEDINSLPRENNTNTDNLTARGNKNKHYVRPEEFEYLIKEYYKHGELTNDLCDCVYKIANRLSYRPNFVNYTFREEMVGDAIERMVFALHNKIYKYNPKKIGKNGKKGNAFLYFTKIAENAFINRIKMESRNREAISNYQEDVYHNLIQKGIDIGSKSEMYSE